MHETSCNVKPFECTSVVHTDSAPIPRLCVKRITIFKRGRIHRNALEIIKQGHQILNGTCSFLITKIIKASTDLKGVEYKIHRLIGFYVALRFCFIHWLIILGKQSLGKLSRKPWQCPQMLIHVFEARISFKYLNIYQTSTIGTNVTYLHVKTQSCTISQNNRC